MASAGGAWHKKKNGSSYFQRAGETRQTAARRAARRSR